MEIYLTNVEFIREWKTLRQKAMKRDNYECQICKSRGKYKPVENVHHIK
ncbi:hypothetical protein [Bacillus cereus group sp. RP43]